MDASDKEGEDSDRKTRRLSAGVAIVREGAFGWLLLMLRAYRNWDFPKGMVEVG